MFATGLARPGRLQSLLLLWLLPLAYGAVFFVLRPAINNDSGMGLRVLEAMRHGGAFNVLSEPSRADISKDVSPFIAAWSPAQWQLPALFQIGGIDLGQALILATTVCLCVGIAGWYVLYEALGFSRRVSLLACLLIEFFRHFLAPLYQYDGGGVMLFAAAPWCALLVWRLIAAPGAVARFVLTFVALLLATYAKLSGFIFVTALIGGATVHYWFAKRSFSDTVRTLLPAALAWVLFLAGFYFFWVSRGTTAVEPTGVTFQLLNLYFPLVSTVVSVFSMTEALGFLAPLAGPNLRWPFEIGPGYAIALPLCALVIFDIVRRWRRGEATAGMFILTTGLLHAIALIVLIDVGAAIYLHDRFFRPASLLLLPCIVEVLLHLSRRFARLAGWAIVGGFACYGALAGVQHIAGADRWPLGRLGFREPSASPGLVAYLNAEFGPSRTGPADRVVYLPSSELPLEAGGARAIATEADYFSETELRALRYRGRAGQVTVVMPVKFLGNGKAEIILRSFVDYDPARWSRRAIDDYFVAFSQ